MSDVDRKRDSIVRALVAYHDGRVANPAAEVDALIAAVREEAEAEGAASERAGCAMLADSFAFGTPETARVAADIADAIRSRASR